MNNQNVSRSNVISNHSEESVEDQPSQLQSTHMQLNGREVVTQTIHSSAPE